MPSSMDHLITLLAYLDEHHPGSKLTAKRVEGRKLVLQCHMPTPEGELIADTNPCSDLPSCWIEMLEILQLAVDA